MIDFLLKAKASHKESQFAAKRMLDINPGVAKSELLRKISQGKALSRWDIRLLKWQQELSLREESLFSFLGRSTNYEDRILPRVKGLPKTFSYERLSELAARRAKEGTSNNRFGIKNAFILSELHRNFLFIKIFSAVIITLCHLSTTIFSWYCQNLQNVKQRCFSLLHLLIKRGQIIQA